MKQPNEDLIVVEQEGFVIDKAEHLEEWRVWKEIDEDQYQILAIFCGQHGSRRHAEMFLEAMVKDKNEGF